MLPNKYKIQLLSILLMLIVFNGWSQTPPVLSATGNQAYCPQSSIPIVTDFNLQSGTNQDGTINPVKAIFIQISTGYVNSQDRLELTGTHLNITAQIFNTLEGKLELRWTGACFWSHHIIFF